METTDSISERIRKNGLLYPMMLIAAIAVIVFSVVGIATMMGWMPRALSGTHTGAAMTPGSAPTHLAALDPRLAAAPAPAATGKPAEPPSSSAGAQRSPNVRDSE